MSFNKSLQKLEEENWKFRIVSTSCLFDMKQEITSHALKGEFDKEFAQEYMPRFNFNPPPELPDAKSLIIVAIPRPPTKATFHWRGKKQSFILPPTYTAYDEKRLRVERLFAEVVGKLGYRIATPALPLKLLAVRSGLAQYGRNNIAYVPGMGSFMRLTAVYTDMPCESDQWKEVRVMERCGEGCDLCQRACPTQAISAERFLLHAERCLTFHNEKEANVPFPIWIKPEWHNCLVGCICCQAACPENQPFLHLMGETEEFTEEETNLLLKGTPSEQLSASTLAKMKALSLTDYYAQMPRNLSVLLH
jgi:epoxyqueuosine reductase